MKTFEEIFVNRLAAADPLQALTLAISQNERELLDLNKQQLAEGKDAEGSDMGEYSDMWAAYKGRYSPIDLKDTGDYQASMYLVVDREATHVRSRDEKEEKLKKYVLKKTGNEPLGISKEQIMKFMRIIREDFQNNFKKEL